MRAGHARAGVGGGAAGGAGARGHARGSTYALRTKVTVTRTQQRISQRPEFKRQKNVRYSLFAWPFAISFA